MIYLVLVSSLLWRAFADDCPPTCADGENCYTTGPVALSCLQAVPFNAAWANATIDVISQSLQNFGFDALYHNTGPPYSIELDVQSELANALAMANTGQFASDIEFQEYVQNIIQITQDAHTRYQKPVCYNAIFVQPFAFDVRVEEDETSGSAVDEPKVYAMRNIYTDMYNSADLYPDVDLAKVLDQQIVAVDGVEVVTAVSAWGDSHETRSNNRGIRFNAAIRDYLYRSAGAFSILPFSDSLTVTLASGEEYSLPWMAQYTAGLGDVAVCSAETSVSTQSPPEPHQRRGLASPPAHMDVLTASVPLTKGKLQEDRTDRDVIIDTGSEFEVSCFVQTVSNDDAQTAGVQRVLVMKVASFSPATPEGMTYSAAWAGFLDEAKTCLSAEFDMVVVDVMQNGGGYVCLGLRLIELLVEDYYNDHTAVQMNYDLPHSALMDQYVAVVNPPDPYPDPGDVEQILNQDTQEPFVDGQAWYYPGRNVTQGGVTSWRSNYFSLDCREAEAMPDNGWRPPRFMSASKLVILTDGTCGSTCASFTKIPQEAGKATFVGAGGLWGEGMDVASFAGGFVCNPGYLQNIANWSNTVFPSFLTQQNWQFGWAAWYSAKLPSRPVQFTVQDPDYREAFWGEAEPLFCCHFFRMFGIFICLLACLFASFYPGFPHASIDAAVTTEMVSSLYDRVIDSSLSRLAAAAPVTASGNCDETFSTGTATALISTTGVLACALVVVAAMFYFQAGSRRGRSKSYGSVEIDEETIEKSALTESLVNQDKV